MEYYMDEKWKLSKDEKNSHSHSTGKSSSLPRSVSTKSPSLMKSFSQKNSFNLSRSCSQKSTSTKSSLSRSSSQKCTEFTRKCSNLAKEQKAKFYIVKRCISMLVHWKKER
ncbi:hypothetical protein ACJIZ3_017870 [Penstemon smallii]|uniref:Uncharacterized protein n=1 Tax=Penstemon smallii TaxID=265156 RepID=A0ABD3SY14_9LAMI